MGAFGVTLCYDPTYGYPWYAYNDVLSTMQNAGWTVGYHNFARSGFNTEQIINGDGVDACNDKYLANGGSKTPLQDAAAVLAAHKGSWNRVLITGGIDNTSWIPILEKIGLDSTGLDGPGTNPFYSATNCQADLDGWDGWDIGKNKSSTTFVRDVDDIASTLNTADPSARVLWVSYFNIAGTGNIGFGTPAPGACAASMDQAMQSLHGQIDQGLTGTTAQRVAVSIGTGNIDPGIQPWYVDDTIGGLENLIGGNNGGDLPGWPHPDTYGAKTIASGLPLWKLVTLENRAPCRLTVCGLLL